MNIPQEIIDKIDDYVIDNATLPAVRSQLKNRILFGYHLRDDEVAELKNNSAQFKDAASKEEESYKAKVKFYREQTDALRNYVFDNNIGMPTQSIFQAIIDECERLKQSKDTVNKECDSIAFGKFISDNYDTITFDTYEERFSNSGKIYTTKELYNEYLKTSYQNR